MIVRTYLEWSLKASAAERAEAVGMLADVFLGPELSPEEKRNAEAALVLALDDPAPIVRRVLARKLACADRAPRAVIGALTRDLPDIAALVAANSPVLGDATLVDLAALGDEMVQLAVAQRMSVSPAVAAAIVEVGSAEANLALVTNPGAEVALSSLSRLAKRFPDDAPLREALLGRDDLPADIRIALVSNAVDHLSGFVRNCGWLSAARAERLAADCAESAAVLVSVTSADDEIIDIVRQLRAAGKLTPQLLLRSLLSGETRLLTATLAELSKVSMAKASGLVHGRSGVGFRAIYRKAGLPLRLEPAFVAALSAWHEAVVSPDESGRLSRRIIERVLTSLPEHRDPDMEALTAVLLRFHAEASREEARAKIAALLAEPAPQVELDGDDLEQRLQDALHLEFQEAA